MYWQPLWAKEKATWSQPQSENERQQSVNDFVCCILCHPRAVLRLVSIIEVLVAFIGKIVNEDVASPDNEHQQSVNRASTECQQSVNRALAERQQSVSRASTERQQSWVLHLVDSNTVLRHLLIINVLADFVCKRQGDMVTAPI